MSALALDLASEASRIAQFMGLPRWQSVDDLGLVARVQKGFPAATAETVARRIDPRGSFLKATDIIPKSTLHRREKDQRPLSQDDSEKVLALSRVFSEALRIYHDDAAACGVFLTRPHPLLGRRAPVDLATESIAGADLVLKLLSKAEAGVAV